MDTTFVVRYSDSPSLTTCEDTTEITARNWSQLVTNAQVELQGTNKHIIEVYVIADGMAVYPDSGMLASIKEMIMKW